ncbi:uncharacterized protein LOC131315167 isoform X2 [Rhododendron vialii]|uniref:uncharacterized protein LOC131315167 isoform X2 n=1 Tax=Rhododendron vialii TaxID=182163 RepID=UPI00265F14AB|nr:uncharacterized protein LOC131315167 isoform X2 [Rhododendron vialii]XP_058200253.1 uncharacterized protein LOC131315167 isoform X2 [Rhododendron vialii]
MSNLCSPCRLLKNTSLFNPFEKKECVGAIDVTHISASVLASNQIAYRGRHTVTTQSVMAACAFDMRFTYVLSGWEGTTNDLRVFLECVNSPTMGFPKPPEGNTMSWIRAILKCRVFYHRIEERYHLNNFRGHGRRPKKILEDKSSMFWSSKNLISLKQMPPYSVRTQKYIPTACCTVHNWIRMPDDNDDLFREYCQENMIMRQCQRVSGSSSQNPVDIDITCGQLRHVSNVRDRIVEQIWASMNHSG